MCLSRSLILLATLVLMEHLGSARNLPMDTPVPGVSQCHNRSQALLSTVGSALQKASQTLQLYSCSAEELDHEDITKDRSSTAKACLPRELAQNGSCLASGKTSLMMTLCLSSIYEDLKMYQEELMAINAKLLMDPQRQIAVDQGMLAAIEELMQALNVNSETVPQNPSFEAPDFYRTKSKLCILLHALRIRAVTIDRVMSYLNSS